MTAGVEAGWDQAFALAEGEGGAEPRQHAVRCRRSRAHAAVEGSDSLAGGEVLAQGHKLGLLNSASNVAPFATLKPSLNATTVGALKVMLEPESRLRLGPAVIELQASSVFVPL